MVDDLDHRVDRRARGVLVGVAHCIAGDRGLVRLRALAAVVAVLDVLLAVVPGAAARGHATATKMPVTIGCRGASPERGKPAAWPAIGVITKYTTIGASSGSKDRRIISLIAALVSKSTLREYSGLPVPSMIPGMSRNWRRTSSTIAPAERPTACDRERAEQVRQEAAEEQADQDERVGQGEAHLAGRGSSGAVLGVRREQDQRRERRRADRIALGDRLGGVADRIERIGVVSRTPRPAGRPSRRCRRRCRRPSRRRRATPRGRSAPTLRIDPTPGWAEALVDRAAEERTARPPPASSSPARVAALAFCRLLERWARGEAEPATAGRRQAALRRAAERAETALVGLERPLGRHLGFPEPDRAEGRSWCGEPGLAEPWIGDRCWGGRESAWRRIGWPRSTFEPGSVRALEGLTTAVRMDSAPDRSSLWAGLRPAREPARRHARRPARACGLS